MMMIDNVHGVSWAYTNENSLEVIVVDLQAKVVADYSDEVDKGSAAGDVEIVDWDIKLDTVVVVLREPKGYWQAHSLK